MMEQIFHIGKKNWYNHKTNKVSQPKFSEIIELRMWLLIIYWKSSLKVSVLCLNNDYATIWKNKEALYKCLWDDFQDKWK